MADYYPLIARAVTGLEKSTGEARRALYERARTALVTQLRGVVPALSESDITRERLALEEAIRKVEGEAARRSRHDVPRYEPPPPRPSAASRREERAAARASRPKAATAAPEPEDGPHPQQSAAAEAPPAPPSRPARRSRLAGESSSLTDEGLKDFRGVVAEVQDLGSAAAQASRSARDTFSAVPPPPPREPERREPRNAQAVEHHIETERLRSLVGEPVPEYQGESETPPMLEPAINVPDTRPQPPRRRPEPEPEADERRVLPRRDYRGMIKFAIAVLLVAGLSAVGYWQGDNIKALYALTQSKPAPKPVRDTTVPAPPKISDRITPGGPTAQAPAQTQPQQKHQPATAAVAQRAVLYEEDPSNPQGKRFVGSVIWRTDTVSSGPNQSPDLAIRADVEVPDRRMTVTWSLRRNADRALPASHTIEIMFNLPADFLGGGITNVPGVLMKQAEQTRGTPLAGLAVKVTTGFFLIGLSAVEADRQRNIQLLKERAWFDIPLVYNNGTRAILAIEKGTPGERIFKDAFRAWGQ